MTVEEAIMDLETSIDKNEMLWIGDKNLIKGLKNLSWQKVISTKEFQILRGY